MMTVSKLPPVVGSGMVAVTRSQVSLNVTG
jgi:hypothetical protein